MRSLWDVMLREVDEMLLKDGFNTAIPKVREASGEIRRRDDKASRVFTITEGLVIFY